MTLRDKIITRGNKIITRDNKIVTGCGGYRLARLCSGGTVSTVGMTVGDAASIGILSFKLSGVCYYFNFTDASTGTVPGTLTTPGAVTTYVDCTTCNPPPELCGACVNPRYRIAGYVDGDFTAINPNCAADAFGACNGHSGGPYNTWDGSFHRPLFTPAASCLWRGTCDNTDTGTVVTSPIICISGAAAGDLRLTRGCTSGTAPCTCTKNIQIGYYRHGVGTPFNLWLGQASSTTVDMDVTYTRTGGDSAGPASLTLELY